MKKVRTLLFLSILPAVLFSACAPVPKVEDPRIVPLQKGQQTQGQPTDAQQSQVSQQSQASPQEEVLGTQNQPQPPAPDQQSQTNQQTVEPKGPNMKVLKDFEQIKATEATISTSKGDITITLYQDKVPLTVTNFLNLAKSGFYNGIKFHRIIPDFMAQVGDPLTKDDSKKDLWGTGGPGYTIADEFDPSLKHDSEGTVSMANTGQPGTGGSQFFITYEATPWLDGKHAVFGKVTSGMDVVRKLEIGDQITQITYK
jgi:cyclophilin family peptidyl-prolyl cis-trans isomerase